MITSNFFPFIKYAINDMNIFGIKVLKMKRLFGSVEFDAYDANSVQT